MDPRVREANRIKQEERKALLNRAFERVVGSQLDKLKNKVKITGKCCFRMHVLPILM